jgi:hypothetical protein
MAPSTDRALTTSASAPRPGFGHHDVVAAWEAAEDRARRRGALALTVPIGFLAAAVLMMFGVIQMRGGLGGGIVFVGIFLGQRMVHWHRNDLLRELEQRGAPRELVAATKHLFGEPAVRRPRDLDDYLAALAVVGIDPALCAPTPRRELPPGAT